MDKQNKIRIPVYVYPDLLRRMDSWVGADDNGSRSEFINDAVRFYLGYLTAEDMTEYLNATLVAVIRGAIEDSLNRLGRMVFKWCVELNMALHMIAAYFGVARMDRDGLRAFAEDEVRRTNGSISFDHALDVQVEDDSGDGDDWQN